MKCLGMMLIVLMGAMCWGQAQAQDSPDFQLNGIVKVRAFIPKDARTAKILGTEREGSGVLIDDQGHILTIGYLILEAEAIEVIGADDQSRVATFVGYDHATGFGVLKVGKLNGLDPVKLGRSSDVSEGSPILMIGHGGPEAIRTAQVIAREEFVGYWEYLLDNAIYVAPPHPNFAGVAMLDANGRLVGIGSIFTRKIVPGYGLVACNMFVPIDLLKPILGDLIHKGRASAPPKPWLGLNADETRGRVFVDRIYGGAPADRAGLRKNDIILRVDQEPVSSLADFYRKVWALGQAGVYVPLTVLQGTAIKDIKVRSADRYQYLRIRPTRKAPPSITEKSI